MAETNIKPPDLNAIVQSLDETRRRDSARLRPYKVTREYRMFRHDNKQPVSQVTAEISFVSDGMNTYEITQASGSSRGETIVRKILDSETQPSKKNRYGEVSDRNYEFALLRQENLNGQVRKLGILEIP